MPTDNGSKKKVDIYTLKVPFLYQICECRKWN